LQAFRHQKAALISAELTLRKPAQSSKTTDIKILWEKTYREGPMVAQRPAVQ